MLSSLKSRLGFKVKEGRVSVSVPSHKLETQEQKAEDTHLLVSCVRFQIDVRVNNRVWTCYKELKEFFALVRQLKQNYDIPPIKFNTAPMTDPLDSTPIKGEGESEAPFLKEIRLSLQQWIKASSETTGILNSIELSTFLELQHRTEPAQTEIEVKPPEAEKAAPKAKKKKTIGLDDYMLLKVVGKGSFGKVLQVRNRHDGKIYAMKQLKKEHIIKRNQVEHTKTERFVLQHLKHHFIVSLQAAFQTDKKLYLILDYCPGGELFFHLGKAGRFTEGRAKFYAAEIVLAIEYLHNRDIIYRDLKPENILLDQDGHVKLTDFGLSKTNVRGNSSTHSFCGTPEYLAPEILRRAGHGKAADWWSLGALLYEMLTGMPPFYSRDRDRLFEKILHSELRFPNYFSKNARSILKELMDRNPRRRLGSKEDAVEVKWHVFFHGMDWDKVANKEVEPPFKPKLMVDANGVKGTSNFDPEFTGMPTRSPDNGGRRYAKFSNFTYNGSVEYLNEDEEDRRA